MTLSEDAPGHADDRSPALESDAGAKTGLQSANAAKVPPPGLSMRAPRPPVTRLRQSVVQAIVIGGVLLISGSLAWAFVIQPELRDAARSRAAEGREDEARGVVRPAEAVTDQPATYDRLPEPRTGAGSGPADLRPAARAAHRRRVGAGGAWRSVVPARSGPVQQRIRLLPRSPHGRIQPE